MAPFSFKPKQLARELLSPLPERARDVVRKRFGLDGDHRMTLEAIGSSYGITRERVRQIEHVALSAIKKAPAYEAALPAFAELRARLEERGALVHEGRFLDELAAGAEQKNYTYFFLVLGDDFVRLKEDDEFHHRWTVNRDLARRVEEALRSLGKTMPAEEVLSEEEMLRLFAKFVVQHTKADHAPETLRHWLHLSKVVASNQLGGWGAASSPSIKIRGVRDLAYLVLRENGSPMHFSEVARAIEKAFGRKAHVATCHNELIKDERFVLIGRGLYALSNWGYQTGTVRDVIRAILKAEGMLTKQEVIARVLKERYVKENTIGVNLQNTKHFKRDKSGKYSIR